MLDKSIPYYHVIMCRKSGIPIPKATLPDKYSFISYKPGDEKYWADIETSVGEFENDSLALAYFQKHYLPFSKELERRSIFIQADNGEKVATLTNWWVDKDGKREASVHWVAVKPDYQKLGLGKVLIFEGMKRMIQIEGDNDVFLHTQTWSYKAIGIYFQAGFEILLSGSIASFPNEYEKAVPVLYEKLDPKYIYKIER